MGAYFFAARKFWEMKFINSQKGNIVVAASIGLLVLIISGCEFKNIAIEKVGAVQINSSKGSELSGTLNLVLNNPNKHAVHVKSAHFDVLMGQMKVGEAQLTKAFKINANSTESYPIELRGDISNALAGGLTGVLGMLSGKNPKITLDGEIKAGNFIYSKKVPVKFDTEIPLKQLMNQ